MRRANPVCSFAISAAVCLSGCAVEPYVAPNATPATAKMTAQAAQVPLGRRVSTLLDFESPTDLTFVSTEPQATTAIDAAAARGGRHCLVLAPGTASLTIKTPTLLEGRPFPADWTLLGAFVLSDRPTTITMSLQTPDKSVITRAVAIGAGGWTPVMIDLAALGGVARGEVGILKLQFTSSPGATVRIDDVMLVDNHEIV